MGGEIARMAIHDCRARLHDERPSGPRSRSELWTCLSIDAGNAQDGHNSVFTYHTLFFWALIRATSHCIIDISCILGRKSQYHMLTITRAARLRSRPPPEWGMSPIEILNFSLWFASQFLININAFALLVASVHPEQEESARYQNRTAGRQIKPITDRVVGSICG